MRRLIPGLLAIGVAASAIAFFLWRARVNAELAGRVGAIATQVEHGTAVKGHPLPPGRSPKRCDVSNVLVEAVGLAPPLARADQEALEAFTAGPDAEGAAEVAPILRAWAPALARWRDAAACDTRGPLATPLDAAPLRLVLAARLADLRWRDDPAALTEGLEAWVAARELMNVGGLAEFVVAADLAADAADAVEPTLLAPDLPDRIAQADGVAFVADHAALLKDALARDVWRRSKQHLTEETDDAARVRAVEREANTLGAWQLAAEEPDAARAAGLRAIDPPPEVTDLPRGRVLAEAWTQVAGQERIANGLVLAAALTVFVEREGLCPRDLDAARPILPKESWRDYRTAYLSWDESACALTVRGLDGGPLRVWVIETR